MRLGNENSDFQSCLMRPKTKNFKMATGLKAGLYQNAQSASYLLPTLPYGHAKGLSKNKPIETQGAL